MQLFDTLRGHTATFDVPTDRPVTMYVCGVTPYDTTHIGHGRTYLIFDVVQRYLRTLGAEVRYCQNVTDVDDPLFERANRDGEAWDELARRETQRLVEDCAAMHMIAPTYFPKASDEIPGMITMIERLLELEHAYEANGSVYFSVATDPDYGSMARLGYEGLLEVANDHGNDPNDPNKRDPLDFALWLAAKPGEPTWDSPWSKGRPGWHIECSTMSTRYLGDQIDIHGGGRDLIFPHHPSEIAQTEAYSGKKPFVQFWMHGGMVSLDGEKMSKSLGNMVFVRDALKEHTADALRWYLLTFPYRSDLDYVREDVVATETKVQTLKQALATTGGTGAPLSAQAAKAAFHAAMENDLDTPAALAAIEELANAINHAAEAKQDIAEAQAILRSMADTVGFWAAEQA